MRLVRQGISFHLLRPLRLRPLRGAGGSSSAPSLSHGPRMTTLAPPAAPARPARAPQQPLSPARAALLVASASSVLVLFYLYALAALLLVVALMAGGVAVAIPAFRVGLGTRVLAWVARVGALGVEVLRSLGIRRGASYTMPVSRAEAPGLFALVEETSARAGMAPPDEVVLLMEAQAWVQLKGVRRGRGRTTLGVGFDFLATLSRAEMAAVLAHEIAHARLVQRGFSQSLLKGSARIQQLAVTLRLAGEDGEADGSGLASALAAVPARLAGLAVRLAAAYTRQDEFAADRLAAEVAGSEPCARALLRADVVGTLAAGCGWRDRVVRVERGPGFSAWLRERLTPATPQDAARMEARALDARWSTEDGTHPPTSDRIAALPAVPVPALVVADPGGSALDLLADPDATAARLLHHIEGVYEREGEKERSQVRARLRKAVRGQGTQGQRVARIVFWVGAVAAGFGFLIAFSTPTDGIVLLAGGGAVAAAAHLTDRRWLGWRLREPLRAPSIALWDAAQERRHAPREEGWETRLQGELRASLPPETSRWPARRRRARHWAGVCQRALAECDYETAYAASALCLREDPASPEGQVAAGITNVYFGARDLGPLGHALGTAGAGHALSWAVGWAFAVAGSWSQAEVYLLDAAAHRPGEATVLALLARAHRAEGRTLEAIRCAREAVALEPAQPAHRLWLGVALLDAGRVRSALEEVAALDALLPDDRNVLLLGVRAHVLMGNHDEAVRRADRVAEAYPGPEVEDILGDAFALGDDAASYDRAEHHYARAQAAGFHPAALLGQAAVAGRRGDAARSRGLYLAALDATPTPVDGSDVPLMQRLYAACRGLLAAGGVEEECGSWWATCVLDGRARPHSRVRLLVHHRSQEDAARAAAEIRGALCPGLEASVVCSPAGSHERPAGPVVPGVYEWEFTA